MRTHFLPALVFALALGASRSLPAGDWPQLLGPTRNGVCAGGGLDTSWSSNGPPVAWHTSVGHGFSGPVVAEHKLIMFQRVNDQETVECLDARSGTKLWSFGYPTTYQDEFGFDNGPRATPAVAGSCVYTFGAEGMLQCLDLASGKQLWQVDAKRDFQAANGFFGMACSPLVEGNALLLNIGGPKGAGIVAFNKTNGQVLWKATDDEASYASPVSATIGTQRFALFFTRKGFVALDPLDGAIRFQYPWQSRNRSSVNAATPLVLGDTIFLSACYGTGAIMLRLQGQAFEKVWSGDDLLSNHYAASVECNGFLYGIHGRTDPSYIPPPKLRCVNINKRTVCWETDVIGAASLIRAGEQLLILTEHGELVVARASPDAFQPECRARIFDSEVRAFPALADGFFYARSKAQLLCLDLRQVKAE